MDGEPILPDSELINDRVMPVDEIVALIPDRNERFKVPGQRQFFTDICSHVLELLDGEGDAQGVPRYGRDQRIILVFEFYRVFDRFFEIPRKNGGNTFKDHLVDAVEILIKKAGIRGIGKILTMINHDTVEDLFKVDSRDGESAMSYRRRVLMQRQGLYDSLIDTTDYRRFLPDYDPEIVRQFSADVVTGVKGMTKLKRIVRGRDLTDPVTFGEFLRALKDSPISGFFKPCDILSNGKTYSVHSSAKQREKLNVAGRHLTVAERYGLIQVAQEMVRQRIHYLNPSLQRGFDELLSDRLRKRRDPVEAIILNKFRDRSGYSFVDSVVSVDFKPADLYDITKHFRGKRDVADLKLDDLPVDLTMPMFEVVVLTKASGDNPTDDQRRMAMNDAVSYIRWAFGGGEMLRFDEKMPEMGSEVEYGGATIVIFDKSLGGQIRFRINDVNREARMKRGIFAPYTYPEASLDEVRRQIKNILSPEYREMRLGTSDVFTAFEALMKPRNVGVYTPDGELKLFDEGATVLDFAASVSPAVFIGFQGAKVKFSTTSGRPFQAVSSPVEGLRNNGMYLIDTCLKEGEVFNVGVQAGPKQYPFCGPMAEGQLRKFLKREDVKDPDERRVLVIKAADDYLVELMGIYKVDKDWIFDAIRKKASRSEEKYSNDNICMDISSGRCDPMLVIADRLESLVHKRRNASSRTGGKALSEGVKNLWEFKVELPHEAGVSAKFFADFSADVGINIAAYRSEDGGDGKAFVYCVFDLEKEGISVRRLFHQMLGLSFKYGIELTKNPCMPREDVVFQ